MRRRRVETSEPPSHTCAIVHGILWFVLTLLAWSHPAWSNPLSPREIAIEQAVAQLEAVDRARMGRARRQPDGQETPLEQHLGALRLPGVHHLGGFVQTRSYWDVSRDTNEEETYEFRNDIRMEAPLTLGRRVGGLVSVHLELDYGMDRDDFHPEEQTFRLFESYADLSWGSLEARLGRQVIRWGKGDGVNPIDNFTPENFKEAFNFERTDRKLPVLASDLKYAVTDRLRWEGIWIPFFQESLIAESGQDWEPYFRRSYRLAAGATVLPESRPGRRFENSVWATRLVHEGSWADLSLSYAYHFEELPTYAIHRTGLLSTVETVWKREHSLGTDFETVYKDWGFRGESVYTTGKPHVTFDLADDDLVEEKDTLHSLLGVDYTYRGTNYLNLQLVQTVILNHNETMDPRAYESSLTFRFWKKLLREKLKLQFSGQYFLTDRDFFYKPEVTYALRDNLELAAALMIFEGESDGLFGQYDPNDQFLVSVKSFF